MQNLIENYQVFFKDHILNKLGYDSSRFILRETCNILAKMIDPPCETLVDNFIHYKDLPYEYFCNVMTKYNKNKVISFNILTSLDSIDQILYIINNFQISIIAESEDFDLLITDLLYKSHPDLIIEALIKNNYINSSNKEIFIGALIGCLNINPSNNLALISVIYENNLYIDETFKNIFKQALQYGNLCIIYYLINNTKYTFAYLKMLDNNRGMVNFYAALSNNKYMIDMCIHAKFRLSINVLNAFAKKGDLVRLKLYFRDEQYPQDLMKYAFDSNNIEVIKYLMDERNINVSIEDYEYNDNPEVIRFLDKRDYRFNENTFVRIFNSENFDINMVNLLYKKGYLIDNETASCMMIHCLDYFDNMDTFTRLEWLLDHGFIPNHEVFTYIQNYEHDDEIILKILRFFKSKNIAIPQDIKYSDNPKILVFLENIL